MDDTAEEMTLTGGGPCCCLLDIIKEHQARLITPTIRPLERGE
ncbi:MAG: hypothetical protein OXH96_17315 [Spirochaetaceae bacterium]|nr:hypothetical protein [Spirochaetaceae bacterium]